MTHIPNPYAAHRSFEMFKLSASDFGIMSMNRRKRTCTDKFLAAVSEGVVHGVYKVVTRSSFRVSR